MLGIGVGLAAYLGLMTLTTALHVTIDLAGWQLVALTMGAALSALVLSGVVIIAMRSLQGPRTRGYPEEYPIHRDTHRSQKVA